ncbi:hypothetical protein MMPV_005487 [Pyropia vietnamensis]
MEDVRKAAEAVLPPPVAAYAASGAEPNGAAATANVSAWSSVALVPRVLRPVASVSTRTVLMGVRLSTPLLIAPFGVHALAHPAGEAATAAAAAARGVAMGVSQHSTVSLEEVAAAAGASLRGARRRQRVVMAAIGGDKDTGAPAPWLPDVPPLFFQVYLLKRREVTAHLVARAVAARYVGLIVTVDSPIFGYRDVDERNGFSALPPPLCYANYAAYEPGGSVPTLPAPAIEDGEEDGLSCGAVAPATCPPLPPAGDGLDFFADAGGMDDNVAAIFDTTATWADIRWLCGLSSLPLLVKGILSPADAVAAAAAGAAAVGVSNHGGRQFGAVPAAAAAVRGVRAALDAAGYREVAVVVDGGVRGGSDVLRGLALGATAVGVGRPAFWGLAAGGNPGVGRVLDLFQAEMVRGMRLTGCANVAAVAELEVAHPCRCRL